MKKYIIIIVCANFLFANKINAQLPDPGFKIDKHTAIVITDPQNDFLSEKGVAWQLVGPSVKKNNTIENIETLFKLGEKNDLRVFISPHFLYDHDHKWQFKGAMHEFAHSVNLFTKNDPISDEGFENSGADFLNQYKKYIAKENVSITSPHKIFGPESNDLILQLRKQKINKIILAGMLSNLCTEAHLRELMEQGFEVAVVKDATAAAILPNMDGYETALVNYALLASHVYTTKEVEKELEKFNSKAYLAITLKVDNEDRAKAAAVYSKYKQPFLDKIDGALSKELLIRSEDVQVLHGFDSVEQAQAYLKSDLFNNDVVVGLKPYLKAKPITNIYTAH